MKVPDHLPWSAQTPGRGYTGGRIFNGKSIRLKKSGNEAEYTNSSILLVKNMLCSKNHCQQGSDSSYCNMGFIPGPLSKDSKSIPDTKSKLLRSFNTANAVSKFKFWFCTSGDSGKGSRADPVSKE